MKKFLAYMTFVSLLCTAFSCSKNTEPPSYEGSSAETVQLCSYKTADITMVEDLTQILTMNRISNSVFIFGMLGDGSYTGYMTTTDFLEKTSYVFQPMEDEKVMGAAMMRLGKSAVMTCYEGNTLLYIYTREGELENTFDLGELASPLTPMTFIASEEGFYINIGFETLEYFNINGEYVGDVNTGGRSICALANDKEGVPIAALSDNDTLYIGSLSEGSITDEINTGDYGTNIRGLGAGFGDYRATAVLGDSFYVLEDTQWRKMSDFSDNDFGSTNVLCSTMISGNEFVVAILNNANKYELRLMTERDISEIKAKKTIKMSTYKIGTGDILDDKLKKFNSQSEDYKVEFAIYTAPWEDYDAWVDDLKKDIIAGNAPDIIAFNSQLPIGTFGAKESIFVDLYDLIDKDPELSRDDFLDGFLEGYETNGKLLMFDTKFEIQTISVKDKFLGGLKTWNYDQFEEVYNNMPEDMFFSAEAAGSDRSSVFMQFVNYSSFVDYKNATCNFDSPEFIKPMKLIQENKIGLTHDEAYNADSKYHGNYFAELLRDDKALAFSFDGISGFHGFKEIQDGYMGEATTFIGYPSEDGRGSYRPIGGGYGIMANSQNIEGAWEFLKFYLFDDEQDTRFYFSGLKELFYQQAEDAAHEYVYIDPETGEEYKGETFIWFDNGGCYEENEQPPAMHEVELNPLTEEQKKEYIDITLDAMRNVCMLDSTIYDIVTEELDYYFEGERSAEETAKIIQDRASVYISEQYT